MNRGKLYVPPQKKKFSVFGDKSQGGKNKRDSWKNRNNEDTMIREDNSNSRNASTVRGRNAKFDLFYFYFHSIFQFHFRILFI